MNTLELKGINGTNPLGFLAALGAFRVATLADSSAKMGWRVDSATPHPYLQTALTAEPFAEAVCEEAKRVAQEVAAYADIIKVPASDYRDTALAHMPQHALPCTPTDADYFAAFACDGVVDKEGKVEPSRLSFSNGGGMQFLLKDYRTLAARCLADEVRANILQGLGNVQPLTNLNWDPAALRSYALRWNDPNSDKKDTDVPANVLAFIGLTWFPSVPSIHDLVTAGFSERGRVWTWALWDRPASFVVVRSLVRAPVARQQPAIAARFCCRRFSESKRLYFSPAMAL